MAAKPARTAVMSSTALRGAGQVAEGNLRAMREAFKITVHSRTAVMAGKATTKKRAAVTHTRKN